MTARSRFIRAALALGLLLAGADQLRAQFKSICPIPPEITGDLRQRLASEYGRLTSQQAAITSRGNAFNAQCGSVPRGSAAARSCQAQLAELSARQQAHNAEVDRFCASVQASGRGRDAVPTGRAGEAGSANGADHVETDTMRAIMALAKRLGWTADEQVRLSKAMNNLFLVVPPSPALIAPTWRNILDRKDPQRELARRAARGDGRVFAGAGKQLTLADCGIFALANATGRPYGEIARLATEIIRLGEWRPRHERDDPQKAIETRGLNGGEMVMLAEMLGRAEVLESKDFPKALKEGRPVMVNVVPRSGNLNLGHEVVLSKTFEFGGETWYEMMESVRGPVRRLYLREKELDVILKENGVVYAPDPGRTPKLLR